jgi:putative membrane protein
VYLSARIPLSFAASLLLAGMLAACDDQANGDETGSTSGSVPVGGTPSFAGDTIPSPLISLDLSDGNIVALLDHANDADSSAGDRASIKARNPRVKQFARLMMADHHRLRKQGADLAKKLDVTPLPPPDDPITPLAHQEMDALEAAERGLDFDRTYIRHEIAAHQTMLDLVDQAREVAGNGELKALIEQARSLIENHLKQAQTIEQELGTTQNPSSAHRSPPRGAARSNRIQRPSGDQSG